MQDFVRQQYVGVGFRVLGLRVSGLGVFGIAGLPSGSRISLYLNLPNPTFLWVFEKLHIRVHNKNLQKSRVW